MREPPSRGSCPDAAVGLLFSMPTRWAFDFHPPLQSPTAPPEKQGPKDTAAYERIVYRYYGGLSRAGHQVRVMHAADAELADPVALAAELPVLVVPALYLVSDELIERLREYASAGGHLVLGIRSLYADEIGRPKPRRAAGGPRGCRGRALRRVLEPARPGARHGRAVGRGHEASSRGSRPTAPR
jgi:beta-galactosidase